MAFERFPDGFEKIVYSSQIPRVVEELQRRSMSLCCTVASGAIDLNRLYSSAAASGDLVSFNGSVWDRLSRGGSDTLLSVYNNQLTYRTLAASGGIVLNSSQGSFTFSLNSNLYNLSNLDSSTGFVTQTAANTFTKRSLSEGQGIDINNPAGIAGNPEISLSNTAVVSGFYGSSVGVPRISVDAQGRLQDVYNIPISLDDLGGVQGAGSLYQLAYFTGAHSVSGDAGLTYNNSTGLNLSSTLTVGGDLIINGSLTSINSDSLSVEDTLVKFGNNNPSDITDLGFYGQYNFVGTDKYTGLFRDATDGWYKLFTGLEAEPTTTVNISGTGYGRAGLVVGDLNAINTTFGHTTINSTVNVSGTSYLAGARFTENVGIQSGTPLQPLVVGGSNGTDTSFEVSIGSNAFVQAFNRNTFSYSGLYFDASPIVFRPNGTTQLEASTNGIRLPSLSGVGNRLVFTTDTGVVSGLIAGNYLQYLRGDNTYQILNTSVVPESGNLYFTNARAINSTLTAFASSLGLVNSSDSILTGIEKLQGQINSLDYSNLYFMQGGNSFGTTARVGTANHDALQIATSGHARIHLTKDGFVGIGTTNPVTNLVVGSSTTAGMEISLSSSVTLQAYNRNIFDYATFNFDGAAMNFRPNGSQKMYIDSTGQLTLPGAGSGAGILVGGDVQWYRDSANVWRTPDSVIVDSPIYGPTAPAGSATLQLATTAFVTQTVSGTVPRLAPNVMLVGGYTPTVSGIDAVKWMVPYHPTTGAAVTYDVKRIDARVETPGSVSARLNVMKYSGNGAFSGTSLLTNNMWIGSSTRETSGVAGFASSTVTSGDKLAVFFENIGTGVGEYTVQVQLLQQ